ncbi:MAG: hypothetical protein CM15mP120_06200 [Pseudomonadota bacterium]|nr:MAG: hypothetical protein CM15mP120_06200 [Pseudomonadota bacterium]
MIAVTPPNFVELKNRCPGLGDMRMVAPKTPPHPLLGHNQRGPLFINIGEFLKKIPAPASTFSAPKI